MNSNEINPASWGDNATIWAAEFMKRVEAGVEIDEGLMLGWFANLIEVSHDKRSGDLVTRQEMEEAVAKAVVEEVADILDDLERAENDAWKPMQVFRSNDEVAEDEVRHETWGKAVELVRARSSNEGEE